MKLIAGCDEAGRGSVAGALYAAAVILPEDWSLKLKDSKKYSPKRREELATLIKDKAIDWCVSQIYAPTIDEIGIQRANIEAMLEAVSSLNPIPDLVILDKVWIPSDIEIPFEFKNEVRADERYAQVAAASILAKTSRDNNMIEHGYIWPDYGFGNHFGYLTPEHYAAIAKYGLCPIHRRSYTIREELLEKYKELDNEIA